MLCQIERRSLANTGLRDHAISSASSFLMIRAPDPGQSHNSQQPDLMRIFSVGPFGKAVQFHSLAPRIVFV